MHTKNKQNFIVSNNTSALHRAEFWSLAVCSMRAGVSETQDFIAEIESKRVVYELLDHNPEKSKPQQKAGAGEGGELSTEGWDPDY